MLPSRSSPAGAVRSAATYSEFEADPWSLALGVSSPLELGGWLTATRGVAFTAGVVALVEVAGSKVSFFPGGIRDTKRKTMYIHL